MLNNHREGIVPWAAVWAGLLIVQKRMATVAAEKNSMYLFARNDGFVIILFFLRL